MNKHLTHLEEAVLFNGMAGASKALDTIWNTFTGKSKITLKVDGSPAIIIGHDPADGKFFVSTKSFFNVNPVMYKTFDEIGEIKDLGLSQKLFECMLWLKDLEFDGYLQGDLLFTYDDIKWNFKLQTYTCHPNTLVYGFDYSYDFGIAFHTHYDKNMNISYDYDFSSLEAPDRCLFMDTSVIPLISDIDWSKPFQQIKNLDSAFVDDVASHKTLPKLITQFFNTKIRSGVEFHHQGVIDELVVWIYTKYQNIIEKRKSDTGKQTQRDECQSCLKFFTLENRPKMLELLGFIYDMNVLKRNCINRLNKLSKIKTWVIKNNEYVPTEPEGYVISDGCEAYKLVDRNKFSHYNFSPYFVKGWDKPTRT